LHTLNFLEKYIFDVKNGNKTVLENDKQKFIEMAIINDSKLLETSEKAYGKVIDKFLKLYMIYYFQTLNLPIKNQ